MIKGYTVEVDPRHFGYQLQAIVRVRPLPGKLHEVERQIQSIPEFTECDKITGEDCFVARLHVRSMEQLDELQRSIVLSHAAGIGEYMDDATVRLMMVLKVNSLARGFSGIRLIEKTGGRYGLITMCADRKSVV